MLGDFDDNDLEDRKMNMDEIMLTLFLGGVGVGLLIACVVAAVALA